MIFDDVKAKIEKGRLHMSPAFFRAAPFLEKPDRGGKLHAAPDFDKLKNFSQFRLINVSCQLMRLKKICPRKTRKDAKKGLEFTEFIIVSRLFAVFAGKINKFLIIGNLG